LSIFVDEETWMYYYLYVQNLLNKKSRAIVDNINRWADVISVGTKSDIWWRKNYGQFSLRYKAEGRPSGFAPFRSIMHQIPGDCGALFPSLFHRVPPLPLLPSSHSSLSLFRIISFESTIMGRRGHAGHVFTKVCAPNTKAAWQTGSIPRVAGRRHTTVLSVISRCLLVGRPVVLCAFLPFFLPARRRGDVGGQHPAS